MTKQEGSLTSTQYEILQAVWEHGKTGATVADVWQAIWDRTEEDNLFYLRRPTRAAETAISGIVLALGTSLPEAEEPVESPADSGGLLDDEDSVLFGPAEAEKRHKRAHVEDVDGDGDLDLLLHFRTQDTGIALGDTEACVIGQTYDALPIMGCDSVRTVPPN